MISISGLSPNAAYLRLLQLAVSQPFPVIPSRVGDCIDLGTVTAELANGERTCFLRGRGFNPVFAIVEAAWMLEGRNDVATLRSVLSDYERYSDDGVTLNGAYGFRLMHAFGRNQLEAVVEELRIAPDSRRVAAVIFGPDDLGKDSRDIPCNTHLYFRLVNGCLDLTVLNRSNDLWLGVPYNWFAFRCIQASVASKLGVAFGMQRHISNCLHLYTRDLRAAEKVVSANTMQGVAEVERTARSLDPLSVVKFASSILKRDFSNAELADIRELWAHYEARRSKQFPESQGATAVMTSFREWVGARSGHKEADMLSSGNVVLNSDTYEHQAVQSWFVTSSEEDVQKGVRSAANRVLPELEAILNRDVGVGTRISVDPVHADQVSRRVILEFLLGILQPELVNTPIGREYKAKLRTVAALEGLGGELLKAREMTSAEANSIFVDAIDFR